MQKTIALHGGSIDYTLKISRRARRLRLAIYRDGSFVVTAPYFMRQSMVEQFIVSKANWVLDKIASFKRAAKRMPLAVPVPNYKEGKSAALLFVGERIAVLNRHYCFNHRAVRVRNQKTRWGSCSRQGNLNFNYRIASLPAHLADYIIIHELCHLKELNHSPRFWSLVAQTVPNYRQIKRELKQYQIAFL